MLNLNESHIPKFVTPVDAPWRQKAETAIFSIEETKFSTYT